MIHTKQRGWQWPVLAAIVGGLLGAAVYHLGGAGVTSPLAVFGQWLRRMSLSGGIGNTVAWIIVTAISLLPALGLLWKGRSHADWLLLLTAAELFAGLYYLVNPALLQPSLAGIDDTALAQSWGLVAGGTVLGTLAAWILLRALTRIEQKPAGLLPGLLLWAAVIYALLVGTGTVQNLLTDMAAVAESNTDTARVASSNVLLAVIALIRAIPELLACWVLLWGGGLAAALDAAPFEEETVALAETIARRCGLVARVSLLAAVAGNLLQLLCFSKAASIHVTIHLPVLTLALCAVLLLLCRYFRRAKAVSDDNATII